MNDITNRGESPEGFARRKFSDLPSTEGDPKQLLRKAIHGQTFYRTATVERQVNEEERTVELAFASETPVDRFFGLEVLSMDGSAVRLERLNNGGALLMNHDTRDQIGVVVKGTARVDDDRVARAVVKFSSGPRGMEIMRDVMDDIRSLISVGYMIHGEEIERGEANAPDTIRVTDWEPLEVSFVAVPADATVGVGREHSNRDGEINMSKTDPKPDEGTRNEAGPKPDESGADRSEEKEQERREQEARQAKESRDERIRDLGKRFKCEDLAEQYCELESATVRDFEQALLKKQGEERNPPEPVPAIRDHQRIEVRPRYRKGSLKGFADEESAYKAGMWARAYILGDQKAHRWVRDYGTLEMRAMSEGINSKGGAVVPEEMSRAIIDLREDFGVARRILRVVPMGSDTLYVPRRTGGVTAAWVGEGATISDSDKSWDNITLVAKKLAALTKFSTEYADDAVIDVASDLASEFAYAFAKKEDEAMIDGDGTSTYGGIYGFRPKLIDGNHAAGAVDVATATHNLFSEIDGDDLEAVRAALPEYASMNPIWLMSKLAKNYTTDALQRAAGGNTVENIGGALVPSYLGDRIVISQAMPKGAATDYDAVVMMLYGDFSLAATMGDRRGFRVQILNELYAASDQIGIIATERVDINVHDLGDGTDAGPVVGLVGSSS